MANKFWKKQIFISCIILALGATIIFIWVAFSQGAFKNKRQYSSVNVTSTVPLQYTGVHNETRHKEFIEKTHLDDLVTDDIEFVKPMKISLTFDNRPVNPNEKPLVRHYFGHFRHKQTESWDLHPFYEIDAFGRKLYLELDYNDKFVSPDLHIVTHLGDNYTQRTQHDRRLSGCFYTGRVKDDRQSSVAVSLCSGMMDRYNEAYRRARAAVAGGPYRTKPIVVMGGRRGASLPADMVALGSVGPHLVYYQTGYIRTSENSYYIEPAEKFVEGSTSSLIHRIKRLPHPTKKVNDVNSDSMEFSENSENQTIIEDDYPEPVQFAKDHRLQKRSTYPFDSSSETEGTCDVVTTETMWNEPEDAARPRRNAEYSNTYDPNDLPYVKVLVVADQSMINYHGSQDELMHYILTLMSHVSFLFKEETIGNAISISVVQVQLYNGDFSNTNSAGTLQKFCNWTKDSIPNKKHNVAVLLTRDTICRNESFPQHCTTLGVAEVNSMCRSGCAVARDKGLGSSYTIAHEIGHTLSMPHDEDKKCERFNKNINIINIMSKVFKNDTKPFTWSPCSRYYITEFLHLERSSCLRSPPSNNYLPTYPYTETLPGDIIDLDRQCELEFGPGRKVCASWIMPRPCEHLYCTANSTKFACTSNYSPWADGTRCGDKGERKICFNGECRFEHELIPRDGAWGSWQPYGQCSRTCGGGIKASQRFCNAPKPVNGGLYCIGENVRYESCNTVDCEPGGMEFRAIQCAEQSKPEDSNSTSPIYWYPDFDMETPEDYCRLFCMKNKEKPSFRLQDKVIDGTKCGPSGFGICVNGICKPGGCDNMLDSSVVLDDCGICGGDNSRCQEISGTYNKPAETIGYNRVVRIPKGSSNVNITQDSYPYVDDNYLVLTDGESGESLLNGNFMANQDGLDVEFGNIKLKYSGSDNTTEWIISEKNKKLPKDLIVNVLSMKNLSPPNIRYKYIIDVKEAPSFGWQLNQNLPWSKCSSICEGKQYRKPTCVDLVTLKDVESNLCDYMDESQMQKRDCNMDCRLTWNIASKSACSPQCGKGIRHIYYNCLKMNRKKPGYSEPVNERHCTILAKPPVMETCNTICNSTRWHYTQWSECSKTCGGGLQRRTAKCVDDRYTPIDDSYCNNSEMIIEQICNTENCPSWILAEKSSCSVPCGGGYRNLSYYCVLDGRIHDNYDCDIHTKPPDKEACNEQACGRWAPLNTYHSCSVTCGEGIERRRFSCKKFNSEEVLDENYCRDFKIPIETRACYRPKCDLVFHIRRPSLKDEFDNSIIPQPFIYTNYKWVPGDWSICSHSCGEGGRSKQYFRCLDDTEDENELMCDPNQKPNNVRRCNQFSCPSWKTGDWSSSCDSNCERYRQVRCTDNSGKIVEDSKCENSKKPENATKCKLADCSYISNTIPRSYFDSSEKDDKRYRWKVGPWKPCSNFCGKGTRRRHVECEDALNEITVVDTLCKQLKKPSITRQCQRYSCKFAWIEGYWSACSASCGTGVKKRNVTCHKVHKGGVMDPIPLPDLYQNRIHHHNYCSMYNKPPTETKCILSRCGDQFVWQPGPWEQCSHQCGRKGRQVRKLHCVNAWTKQPVLRKLCRRKLRPPRKRKCNQWKCLYKSCNEVKRYTRTTENKDYIISIHGRPVQIHCYKMDTNEPQEYISLHSDTTNFAEIYDKRLIDVRSCPNGGQRRDNCPCDYVGSERSGFTKFWKVRLNITSMKIIGEDFTFSKQIKGTRVPYGTAGDCYSSVQNCAQGRFIVDLSHTSFRLSKNVRWEALGPYASAEIQKTDNMASGKCGGYCGNCIPDPNIGLAVEIT